MGFVASVCQPSTFRMLICPEARSAQNNIAAVSADGSTVCVLIRRLSSSCRRSIAIVVLGLHGRRLYPALVLLVYALNLVCCPRAAPLGRRQASESEEAVASFLQAVRDGAMTQPPLADEGLATGRDLLGRGRVNHGGVIGADLVVQAFGCMRQQVAMLVNRAPLPRHGVPNGGDRVVEPRRAVDEEELGRA